jgi:hypothetical protein
MVFTPFQAVYIGLSITRSWVLKATPFHLRLLPKTMVTGTPYHMRLAPPPASGWTPLEMTFEVATGRQNDGLKEDTVADSSVDFQRRAEPIVSQPRLNFDTPA